MIQMGNNGHGQIITDKRVPWNYGGAFDHGGVRYYFVQWSYPYKDTRKVRTSVHVKEDDDYIDAAVVECGYKAGVIEAWNMERYQRLTFPLYELAIMQIQLVDRLKMAPPFRLDLLQMLVIRQITNKPSLEAFLQDRDPDEIPIYRIARRTMSRLGKDLSMPVCSKLMAGNLGKPYFEIAAAVT